MGCNEDVVSGVVSQWRVWDVVCGGGDRVLL